MASSLYLHCEAGKQEVKFPMRVLIHFIIFLAILITLVTSNHILMDAYHVWVAAFNVINIITFEEKLNKKS